MDIKTINNILEKAENLLNQGLDSEAKEIYLKLEQLNHKGFSSIACFRLGEIYNRLKEVNLSIEYHIKAFKINSSLAKHITSPEHDLHLYINKKIRVKEIQITKCPLCKKKADLHSCYNIIPNNDYLVDINPVRIWRYCNSCHHVFAASYPVNYKNISAQQSSKVYSNPKTDLYPSYGKLISNIIDFSKGKRLLEIGIGAGEMLAVAKEYMFDVMGIEINYDYAKSVESMFEVPVKCLDFLDFKTKDLFDVIIMGDVLEHLVDPIHAIKKVYSLLNKDGVFWLSTPNFDSAYTSTLKDKDPMWKVQSHLHYFSFKSLKNVLTNYGFNIKRYDLSSHFKGSMEVTSIKKT